MYSMAKKVLIVDDSIVFRSQIKTAIEKMDGFEVIGVAQNGSIALQKIEQLKPDLVTLDVEMPEKDGIETLKELRARGDSCRVIMFSSLTQRGGEKALEALSCGADDVLGKPDLTLQKYESAEEAITATLVPKIQQFFSKIQLREAKMAAGAELSTPTVEPESSPLKVVPSNNFSKRILSNFRPIAIVIGSSTGGPTALEEIFRDLEKTPRCPIFIAQHMPPVFTKSLAARLASLRGLSVCEATQMQKVEAGKVYVAPGDYHMEIIREGGETKIKLNQSPPRNMVRPAVDYLFESAAKVYGSNLMGFVLTGMGEDGKDGSVAIKEVSGGMMIQDEESCVVYGMPRAVAEMGSFDAQGDLIEIHKMLKAMTE